jgi:hypothetical protein
MKSLLTRKLLLAGALCWAAIQLQAQVTIGADIKPLGGALLDLKEKNPANPAMDNTTATKGLLLPRVSLTDTNYLYPMLSSGYNSAENTKHTGLVVYHVGSVGSCPGTYTWTGSQWIKLGNPCITGTIGGRCGTGSVTLSATSDNGDPIRWYNAGGALQLTTSDSGAGWTTPTDISSTTIYYAEAYNSTTNVSSSPKIPVTATVNPLPTISGPSSTDNGNGIFTLSAIASNGGDQVRWYDATGTHLGTTNSGAGWTTPTLASTTTFYAEAYNSSTGCASGSRTTVTAARPPAPTPTLPTISGTKNGSTTGKGTVRLSATVNNGDQIRWYDTATDGTHLGTTDNGSDWTTPEITSTTTYYAEAYNSKENLTSSSRTAVTAAFADFTSECKQGTVNLFKFSSGLTSGNWVEKTFWLSADCSGKKVFLTSKTGGFKIKYQILANGKVIDQNVNGFTVQSNSRSELGPAPVEEIFSVKIMSDTTTTGEIQIQISDPPVYPPGTIE